MSFDANITLQTSKLCAAWTYALIAFAAFCTVYSVSGFLGLVLLLVIVCYGINALRHTAWRNAKTAITGIQHKSHQRWYLQNGALEKWLVHYKGVSFRNPRFIIATFEKLGDKRNITVVIPQDATTWHYYTHLLTRLWF